MSYNVNIAQTPALASGDPRDNLAPAINNGEAFDNQVEEASLEADTRKRLHERDPNVVTAAEVKVSRRRLVAVETYEAQVSHGMGSAATLDAVANLTTVVANLTTAVANLTDQVNDLSNAMDDRFNAMDARFTNARRRERNRISEWVPLLVERSGANPIGVVPAAVPASRAAVIALTGAQITNLELAYNLPAGTFGGANLSARRSAALDYFLEG